MSGLFESLMLVCFGMSWPISLVKHIKAGTAKGTSIVFTVFIIIGYLAGIAAKICSSSFGSFVMAVYIFNLMMVLADLIVYFINLNHDKMKEGNSDV